MIRLMEVLLYSGGQMSDWRTAQIHQMILTTCGLKHDILSERKPPEKRMLSLRKTILGEAWRGQKTNKNGIQNRDG